MREDWGVAAFVAAVVTEEAAEAAAAAAAEGVVDRSLVPLSSGK